MKMDVDLKILYIYILVTLLSQIKDGLEIFSTQTSHYTAWFSDWFDVGSRVYSQVTMILLASQSIILAPVCFGSKQEISNFHFSDILFGKVAEPEVA